MLYEAIGGEQLHRLRCYVKDLINNHKANESLSVCKSFEGQKSEFYKRELANSNLVVVVLLLRDLS